MKADGNDRFEFYFGTPCPYFAFICDADLSNDVSAVAKENLCVNADFKENIRISDYSIIYLWNV